MNNIDNVMLIGKAGEIAKKHMKKDTIVHKITECIGLPCIASTSRFMR